MNRHLPVNWMDTWTTEWQQNGDVLSTPPWATSILHSYWCRKESNSNNQNINMEFSTVSKPGVKPLCVGQDGGVTKNFCWPKQPEPGLNRRLPRSTKLMHGARMRHHLRHRAINSYGTLFTMPYHKPRPQFRNRATSHAGKNWPG